jgi:hypothetical protein
VIGGPDPRLLLGLVVLVLAAALMLAVVSGDRFALHLIAWALTSVAVALGLVAWVMRPRAD